MTYKEEHPYEQRKVYWARRPSSNHRGRRDGFHGQVSHGIHSGDGSRYDSSVLCRAARLRGNLSVTFEEGTWSAWLYDLLNPLVEKLVVCNPRKNALLKDGNKSDRIDARKLAELLRGNQLK